MKKTFTALLFAITYMIYCFVASAQESNNPNPRVAQSPTITKDDSEVSNSTLLEGLDRNLKSMELFVTIALSLIGVLLTVGGGFVAFMQYRWEREQRQWEVWKESFMAGQRELKEERDRSLALFISGIRDSLDSWKREVTPQIMKECSETAVASTRRSFDELSRELRLTALEQTRVFAQEVLMQTAPARGMLYSRFGRLSRDLAAIIETSQVNGNLQEVLWRGVQDWHTLGQLYSVERDQLKQGLGTVREHPIPEARDWLKILRLRHRDDSEIVALVREALATFDELVDES